MSSADNPSRDVTSPVVSVVVPVPVVGGSTVVLVVRTPVPPPPEMDS